MWSDADWISWINKECVAVLIELYKNDVSFSCVGSHFLSDIHHGIQQGCVEVGISTGFDHGQILKETATHS